jgi:Tfp pilus assembly protein PilE
MPMVMVVVVVVVVVAVVAVVMLMVVVSGIQRSRRQPQTHALPMQASRPVGEQLLKQQFQGWLSHRA